MQDHLDRGCAECSEELGFWRDIHAAARRENRIAPPESAVRTVKGLFAIHGPGRAAGRKPAIAQLLWDSFNEPLAAGVRSVAAAPRQLLFGAGEHRVDLRMEPEADSESVSLVGQVLDSADPDRNLEGIAVLLLKGDSVLATASTNRFGEFHLQCNLQGWLELRITLPQGKELSVGLVEPR